MTDDTKNGEGTDTGESEDAGASAADPFANLEGMMGNVPGGEYFVTMLKNNPEAQAALSGMDQNDPQSMLDGLRRLLGVFGVTGGQADMLMGMAQNMMSNPEAAMSQMQGLGMGGVGGMFGGMAGASGPAGAAGEPGTPQTPAGTPPASEPVEDEADGPIWEGIADDAVELIGAGSERSAFELLTQTLDDPDTEAYDPRNDEFASLTAVLEVFAAEAKAAGRQIPTRFRALYQRLAMHMGHNEPAPENNPPFTDWCASLVEEASRPR